MAELNAEPVIDVVGLIDNRTPMRYQTPGSKSVEVFGVILTLEERAGLLRQFAMAKENIQFLQKKIHHLETHIEDVEFSNRLLRQELARARAGN